MTLGDALFTARSWLILPEALRSFHAAAGSFLDSPQAAQPPPPESPLLSVEEGVGIVSIRGPFMRRPDAFSRLLFGALDSDSIMAAIKSLSFLTQSRKATKADRVCP